MKFFENMNSDDKTIVIWLICAVSLLLSALLITDIHTYYETKLYIENGYIKNYATSEWIKK